MTLRLSLLLFFLGLLCGSLSAQSVVITSKKTTYTRKKPISDYKKTFTINYPKVKATTPTLSKKIENTIGYGIDLKDELGEVQWLEEANYEIQHNQNGI